MYIADLTEILCKKKRLPLPATDWVLCLADLTLALPLDRTVSSLEGKNDLALVRTQWAVEHGLRIGDRRGGDPSGERQYQHLLAVLVLVLNVPHPQRRYSSVRASLYRHSASVRVWPTLRRRTRSTRFSVRSPSGGMNASSPSTGITSTWVPISLAPPISQENGRSVAIPTDAIRAQIMPSESRAFFDSMKTTSFHITLVASCKLTGRAGGFKINVWRETGQKRYEFEAENGKQAGESSRGCAQDSRTGGRRTGQIEAGD
jgi:hypothetical protein